MGFFKWIWNHSFLGTLTNTIRYRHYLNKDHKKYDDILYGRTFPTIIQKYLNIDLSRDWVGRLYGVINPNIDINGKFDPATMIIEIDGDNTNNSEYVHNWIYKQLNLVSNVFPLQEMYDSMTIDITHVGPIEQDNFLIVFDLVNRQELVKWRRKFLLHSLFLAIIATILLIILL